METSRRRFRPAFYERDSCILEINARVHDANRYEIYMRGSGEFVTVDTIIELLDYYINHRFYEVESVDIWLVNITVDTSYIQYTLNKLYDIKAKVFNDGRDEN